MTEILASTLVLWFLGMSHGINIDGRDYLVTNDCQLLYTEKIADLFHNCYCHGLRNKPKFYMFNICRGDLPNLEIERMNEDYHKMCNDTNDSVEMSSPHEDEYDGNGEISFKKGDYMVVYSTIKGFVSKRHRKNGSIFVRELANSINELMTKNNNNFVEMVEHACIATSHRQSSGIVSMQLPEITKTLRAPFDLILRGNISNTKNLANIVKCHERMFLLFINVDFNFYKKKTTYTKKHGKQQHHVTQRTKKLALVQNKRHQVEYYQSILAIKDTSRNIKMIFNKYS